MGNSYWQKRFELLEEKRNQTAKQTLQSVTPAFDKAQAQIEKEINAWYERFAKNNEISLQEAKRLLNTRELKEFKWDVEEYIKYGRQNALDQKWLKELENASSRYHISRLEALRIRTQNAAEVAFGNELDQLDQMAAKLLPSHAYLAGSLAANSSGSMPIFFSGAIKHICTISSGLKTLSEATTLAHCKMVAEEPTRHFFSGLCSRPFSSRTA